MKVRERATWPWHRLADAVWARAPACAKCNINMRNRLLEIMTPQCEGLRNCALKEVLVLPESHKSIGLGSNEAQGHQSS